MCENLLSVVAHAWGELALAINEYIKCEVNIVLLHVCTASCRTQGTKKYILGVGTKSTDYEYHPASVCVQFFFFFGTPFLRVWGRALSYNY